MSLQSLAVVQSLLSSANGATGGGDATLTDAVGRLIGGYGSGGSTQASNLLYTAAFSNVAEVKIDWQSQWNDYDCILAVPAVTLSEAGWVGIGYNNWVDFLARTDCFAVSRQEYWYGYTVATPLHSSAVFLKNNGVWSFVAPNMSEYVDEAAEKVNANIVPTEIDFCSGDVSGDAIQMTGQIQLYGLKWEG